MKFLWIKCDFVKCLFLVSGGGRIRYKMPADSISFAVTTGLGVSVLAGLLSGVCYVLAHGIRRKSTHRSQNQWYCDVCGAYFKSVDELLGRTESVKCSKCQSRVCKTKCSKHVRRIGWTCQNCLKPQDSWFQGIINSIQPAKDLFFTTMNPADTITTHGEDLESVRKRDKEQVRDFIERLVNVMLGDNVDDATVTRLYNGKQYLPVSGESPCTAHAALKQLIERLLKETANLPNLQIVQDHPALPSDDTNRTYEDLLATAIINKVISSCQNNLPSSSANSVSSRVSTSSRPKDEKEYFFGEETLDNKWKTTDLDTTSVSSMEEWIHDSSTGSKKYVDKVTLMIKQDIEEIYQSESEDEQDDSEYFRSNSSLFNDDDTNWFLQKRHFQGTHSPVPVPMLVPKPTVEAKVLIGDKEVDETSDLSDVASEFGENDSVSNTHNLLIESKTLIGGKNVIKVVDGVGEESGASSDSGVKEFDEADCATFDDSVKEIKNKTDITVDDDNIDDSSILSVYSNTEKEAEYTEKYGSLPRTILKTPTPPLRKSLKQNSKMHAIKSENKMHKTNTIKNNQKHIEDEALDIQFVGNYSKREKEKWKHAIQMKNNPYSKENIEERIRRSSSATSSLFGSDYYARQASSPSGAKVKSSEINGISWPPLQDEIDHPNDFHQAVPAVVTPEDEDNSVFISEDTQPPIKPEIKTLPPVTYSSVNITSEFTSDSDLSYVNFYDVEHSQVYRKSKDEYKPFRAVSPGVYGSFKMSSDENSNHIVIEKENNSTSNFQEEEIKQIVTNEAPVPIARPRKLEITNGDTHKPPLFTKAPPPVKQRSIVTQKAPPAMKRNKSESDMQVGSFDKPFTVLQKKKDNTLISRIYSSMNFKTFALGQTQHVSDNEKPTFKSQMSLDSKISELSLNQANSEDDRSSKTGRMSFFSSEEDLLSLNSNSSNKRTDVTDDRMEQQARRKKYSVSSEDGILSDSHSTPIQKISTPKFIYSSSEDLLSLDEPRTIPRKKDNTLISKIYMDPNVRNFALNNRDYIPETPAIEVSPTYPTFQKSKQSNEEYVLKETVVHENHSAQLHLSVARNEHRDYSDLSSADISLDYIDGHEETNGHMEDHTEDTDLNSRSDTPDPDIDEIAKKRLVRNILGQLSKSQSNISVVSKLDSLEDDGVHVSVKDLKKKFENYDAKNVVVSSLTARSLSKQIKESLRE